jgi:hypothetical protein
MSRSKKLEPCGRCHTMTAVRVALPCGRLVSMCIPCASVFARFLSKRIREMARCVGQRENAVIHKEPLGTILDGAPVCLSTSLTKDSVHSLPAMSAPSPRRARSGRLRVIDKRGGDTNRDAPQLGLDGALDGAADEMTSDGVSRMAGEFLSRPVPSRGGLALKCAGASGGGGG